MNVLYVYAGARKNKFSGNMGSDYPDTPFYGLNHLASFGITAETKEFDDVVTSAWLRRLFGFRTRHALFCFFVRRYDIVFGPSILYTALFKRIICPRTKFILLDISTTRTLEANREKRLRRALIIRLLNEMDSIVCLSHVQATSLTGISPRIARKVSYVPLGVDTVFYQPHYDSRADCLLSVGRDNGRDYATVMDVARLMPEQTFHIVCSKRNLAGIREIPKNVLVFYDLPPQELKLKYTEAKALLLITHRDAYTDGADCSGQTVLLDAMASGLPVIASRKRYLEDYVRDGREAILVDFYDPVGIQAGINALRDTARTREMTLRARRRVEGEFSTIKMAEHLAGVFTRVMKGHINL